MRYCRKCKNLLSRVERSFLFCSACYHNMQDLRKQEMESEMEGESQARLQLEERAALENEKKRIY